MLHEKNEEHVSKQMFISYAPGNRIFIYSFKPNSTSGFEEVRK